MNINDELRENEMKHHEEICVTSAGHAKFGSGRFTTVHVEDRPRQLTVSFFLSTTITNHYYV